MRNLGYARVSTADQTLDLQLDALATAGVEERDVFTDKVSGSRVAADRPGLARLLDYAQEGDTITVWRIDRLGRSLIDVLSTVQGLTDRGVAVRSISDGIDPSTPAGRLMLGLMATLAQYEKELIRERVVAGIAASKARGTKFGRPPVDPAVIAAKLEVAREAQEVRGLSAAAAAQLVGWSRATLYRHQASAAAVK